LFFPFFVISPTLLRKLLDHGFHFLLLRGRQDGVNLFLQLVPHLPDMLEVVGPQSLDPHIILLEDFPDLLLLFGCKPQLLGPLVVRRIARCIDAPAGFRLLGQPPVLGEDPAADAGGEDQDERKDNPQF